MCMLGAPALFAAAFATGPFEPEPQPASSDTVTSSKRSREPSHQYVLAEGCHFVIVTGVQSSSGAPSAQRTTVCRR